MWLRRLLPINSNNLKWYANFINLIFIKKYLNNCRVCILLKPPKPYMPFVFADVYYLTQNKVKTPDQVHCLVFDATYSQAPGGGRKGFLKRANHFIIGN